MQYKKNQQNVLFLLLGIEIKYEHAEFKYAHMVSFPKVAVTSFCTIFKITLKDNFFMTPAVHIC